MARKDSNWRTRGTPTVEDMVINQSMDYQAIEGKSFRQRAIVVISATCRYLSNGVRILGQAYSIYDDRNSQ